MNAFRIEKDAMGEIKVPAWAYWGAQTQRAIENFSVSGITIPIPMIKALAMIKKYAAEVNYELGLMEENIAYLISESAEEIIQEKWNEHFPLDIFQTGSGTSTNMNINEVISNIANEHFGSPPGSRYPIHPNDHINKGQSSNDVIPSAIHISARIESEKLIDELKNLQKTFELKIDEFKDIIKIGRTHLQDAVPMTLGQEFSGYKTQIENSIKRIQKTYEFLEELPLGGTAIGTGINTHPEFGKNVIKKISNRTNIQFRESKNKFEAISSKDALVEFMSSLNSLAVSLTKIANDLRLLSSGPRAGFGEIILPSLQPGSSIMPGKINPVIPEMMIQTCAFVMGCNFTVTIAGQNSPLELNVMMPLIAYCILNSIKILKNSINIFTEKCVSGIQVNKKRCEELVEWSLALITPLSLKIGYDRASEIAYKALKLNKTIRQVLIDDGILTEKEIEEILDIKKMTENKNNT